MYIWSFLRTGTLHLCQISILTPYRHPFHHDTAFHSTWTLPFLPHHLPGSWFRPGPPGKAQDRGDQNDGGERNHHTSDSLLITLSSNFHYSAVNWSLFFRLLVVLSPYKFSRETPATRIISTLDLEPLKPMVRSYRNHDGSTAPLRCHVPLPQQTKRPLQSAGFSRWKSVFTHLSRSGGTLSSAVFIQMPLWWQLLLNSCCLTANQSDPPGD